MFCHEVLLTGLRIYEADPDRRVDFESETMVRAWDERHTREWANRVDFESLRERLKNEQP